MERNQFKLILDVKKCKGCGLCITFCPKKVFDPGKLGKPAIARQEDCIGCGQCEYRCPDYAIRLTQGVSDR